MHSPVLLEELRCYWRFARPRHWLFPGEEPTQPLSISAVHRIAATASPLDRLAREEDRVRR